MEQYWHRGNFMKKQSFLVLLLSTFLLTGCVTAQPESSNSKEPASSEPASQSTGGEQSQQTSTNPQPSTSSNAPWSTSYPAPSGTALSLTAPETDIHTDLQYSYLKDPDWRNIKAYIPTTGADGGNKGDKSHPKALSLKFDEVANADTYYVQISKSNTFANAPVLTSTKKSYDFYNAEIGTKYYYKAAVSEEGLATATVKEYNVDNLAPRMMHVDGVINFRDTGGWKSTLVPNGVVKQGMYYRCAQFNNGSRKNITTAGLQTIKELGIKVDIDMRDSYNVPSTSPLNTTEWPVEILKASVASSTEDGRWEGDHNRDHNIAKTYKSIFEAIKVADQKPIALHCTHGADRTGIMSFFLLGLLGVDPADIGRDYILTRFAGERAVLPETEFDNWVAKTMNCEGATFAEKTYNHLKNDIGVPADTLETIREKFVPGYTRPAGA